MFGEHSPMTIIYPTLFIIRLTIAAIIFISNYVLPVALNIVKFLANQSHKMSILMKVIGLTNNHSVTKIQIDNGIIYYISNNLLFQGSLFDSHNEEGEGRINWHVKMELSSY